MSEKKHIDRIFQESFKDFEATPSDAVWVNIEAELKRKKKRRRIIPIWWRYAGVAALLLVFLSLGGIYLSSSETNSSNQIVDVEDSKSENDTTIINETSNELNGTEKTTIVNNSDLVRPKAKSSVNYPKAAAITNSNSEVLAKTIVSTNHNQSQSELIKKDSSKEIIVSKKPSNTNAVAHSNVGQSNISNATEKGLIEKDKQKALISGTSKKNIALAESKIEIPENTLQSNSNPANSLTIEEALDKNKDIIPDDKPENRWSVAPNIAPVYFNTLNEGSSIDGQFNSNSKTGDVNMSYGISTSYAVNKKFKVRSGINKVSLGYNTNDVVVFQSTGRSSSALKNINESGNSLAVASDQALESNSISSAVVSTNSSINQSFGYIEVPLEIQYTFVDTRLGVNVIGGFSSFFLDNNELYSETNNGRRTYLGEANNINDVSYSANLGLGLNYRFSKKIDFNLEPTFKYQFNTFSNTSGDFTPFFIGVYTGFAIKF
jgi:hypothetical protein